jgi:hypothetical protein
MVLAVYVLGFSALAFLWAPWLSVVALFVTLVNAVNGWRRELWRQS